MARASTTAASLTSSTSPAKVLSWAVGRARRCARWMEQRPFTLSLLALLIATGVSALMADAAGLHAARAVLGRLRPNWLALIFIARLVAFAGYAAAHRAVLGPEKGAGMPAGTSLKLTAFGAAATSIGGGFATDHKAMRGAGATPRQATVRVLHLGALEWATLAPAAWCSALTLLDTAHVERTVTIPWLVGVPVGFALSAAAVWHLSPRRLARCGGWKRALARTIDALRLLREQLLHPLRRWAAWVGMGLYWSAEIVCLWAALRAFGQHASTSLVVLGYATGHVLTPRSLPLSGAGVTELLLPLSLTWVGLPLAPAVLAVFTYRIALLSLSIPPAMISRKRVHQIVGIARADR
jgi:putative heme transporter